MANGNPLGYSGEELRSEMPYTPRFACPKCHLKNWGETSVFQTTPTRLWKATSVCKNPKCRSEVRWLIDPDKTIGLQTEQMHRPLGF